MDYNSLFDSSIKRRNVLSWIDFDKNSYVLLIGERSRAFMPYFISLGIKNDYVDTLDDAKKVLGGDKYSDIIVYGQSANRLFTEIDITGGIKQGKRYFLLLDNTLAANSLSGYEDPKTHTFFSPFKADLKERTDCLRKELQSYLNELGVGEQQKRIFYTYPSNEFTEQIFSDVFLPQVGQLHNSSYPISNRRIDLYPLSEMYDYYIRAGVIREFMNSFLIVLGNVQPDWDYVKFSVERKPEYRIITRVKKDKIINKIAFNKQSAKHVNRLPKLEGYLNQKCRNTRIKINHCISSDDGTVYLEYIDGSSLDKILDEYLYKDDEAGFSNLINQYIENIHSIYPEENVSGLDIDLIFQNIIINQDTWNVIDYEWTFTDRELPVKYLIYRAFYYYYYQSDVAREKYSFEELLSIFDLQIFDDTLMQELERKIQNEIGDNSEDATHYLTRYSIEELMEYKKMAEERMDLITFWKSAAEERMQILQNQRKELDSIKSSKWWRIFRHLMKQ